ncbi:MAG: hypothetical protein R2827_02135 [Bdellovibrionales bacterium]
MSGSIFMDSNNQVCIELAGTGQKLRLGQESMHYVIVYSFLKDGDYLSGDGHIEITSVSSTPLSINYVGLKRILGKWVAPNNDIFHFKSFNQLDVQINERQIGVGERSLGKTQAKTTSL